MAQLSPQGDRPTTFEVHSSRDDRGLVLELRGELDLGSAGELEERLPEIEASGERTRVLLDLTPLDFMDSTGLRLVVQARRMAEAAGRTLCLRGASGQVQRLFELTSLTESFTFVETDET